MKKIKIIDAAICFAIALIIAATIISFMTAWHHVELRRQALQERAWY